MAAAPSPSVGPSPGAADLGVAAGDLQQMDWDAVSLPPGFCGIPTVTQLDGGMARASSETWGPVTVAWFDVSYGDLVGDDADEAVVSAYCDNGGGTGSSTLEYALVTYAVRGGRLIGLGTLTAQVQEANQLPTTLSVQEWGEQSLVVNEHYYRASDATCCPSGVAETTWTWDGDIPSPGAPHVLE